MVESIVNKKDISDRNKYKSNKQLVNKAIKLNKSEIELALFFTITQSTLTYVHMSHLPMAWHQRACRAEACFKAMCVLLLPTAV